MRQETLLAQAGSLWDERTGAISMPIYQVATFRHPALGKSTGYDYSRTANPSRTVLEQTMAAAEGGARASAFSSGMAAVDAVLRLFAPGDAIVVTEDLYGGTFRLLEGTYRAYGLEAIYVDTSDTDAVAAALGRERVRGLFLEVPTNPMLRVADLGRLVELAHARDALVIVDNTFLTPVLLRPFDFGADLAVYSATKYLSGHNDVVAGMVTARTADLGERIAYIQNAVGAILGPMDSWLLLRGMKTLPLRLARQQENAQAVAEFLAQHPRVSRVFYPGLASDPGHAVMKRQARGFGAMIAMEIDDARQVAKILESVKVFLFAESLGGTESLITFPAVQTHASIDAATRERLGINDRLLRLSVGIEHIDDLIGDLAAAL